MNSLSDRDITRPPTSLIICSSGQSSSDSDSGRVSPETTRNLPENTDSRHNSQGIHLSYQEPLEDSGVVQTSLYNDSIYTDVDNDLKEETKDTTYKTVFDFFTKQSKRQKLTLAICAFATFFSSCSGTILVTFFSQSAQQKGMSIGYVGFVFAVFQMSIVLTTMIFGSNLTKWGPKLVYASGLFMVGVYNIFFGTLTYCPDGVQFISMCLICRIVGGIGYSAFITASFAILSSEFSEEASFVLGLNEAVSGFGYMTGPVLGGLLFDYGGFILPFCSLGCVIILTAMFVLIWLPKQEKDISVIKQNSMFHFLRSPLILVAMVCTMLGMFGVAALDAIYNDLTEPLELPARVTGGMSAINSLTYAAVCPLWGYLCEHKNIQSPVIITGMIVTCIGYLILAPSSILPIFKSFSLPSVIVGLVVTGLPLGTMFVPTIKCMLTGALELGCENNMETNSLISGLYNFALNLGASTGPVVIAYLTQEFGISIAFTSLGLSFMTTAFVVFVYFACRWIATRRRRNTYDKL